MTPQQPTATRHGAKAGIDGGEVNVPPSNVVNGSAERVEAYAAELGQEANQSSVLVFHEDPAGPAARFVYHGLEDREAAVRLLRGPGIEGGSLDEDCLTVIVIDERHEASARQIAEKLGIRPKRTSGTVVFVGREGSVTRWYTEHKAKAGTSEVFLARSPAHISIPG